jgi:hypothetical protein
VPDVNGDTWEEFAVGAPGANQVYLFSGVTATQIESHTSADNGSFGSSLAGLPDLNGDGRGDLLVGAHEQSAQGHPVAGRAFIFYGPSFPQYYSKIRLSVSEIDMGDQSIEAPETFTLLLTNQGLAELTFIAPGIELAGLTPGEFTILSPLDTSPLGPGLSRTIEIALSTVHTGIKKAQLVITTNDITEPQIRVPISAVATHPDVLHPYVFYGDMLTISDHGDSTRQTEYHFGVAQGDINGDGHDDLVAGYPHSGAPSAHPSGAVSVVYGRPDGIGILDLQVEGAPASTETRFLGNQPDAFLGWAVASGDINGDGFDDVLIGAPREDPDAGMDAGKVYIVYGRDTLPGEIISFAAPPGSHGETQIHGFQGGEYIGEAFGSALAVGDFNADGFDDIAIGAPWSSPWSRLWAGRVYVIWGRVDLPGQILDLHDGVGVHGEVRIIAEWTEDNLGEALAAGDLDGDGLDDLIIGARMGDPLARVDAGRGYVVYGSALSPGLELDLRSATDIGAITHILGDEVGAQTGDSVACGDVNADGFDDILVGAPLANPEGVTEAGEVAVIWGGPNFHGATIDLQESGTEVRARGSEERIHVGKSAGVADLTGDGHIDVVISNEYQYYDWIQTGRILWGESLGMGDRIDLLAPSAAVFGDHYYSPPAIAPLNMDLNRDGFSDLACSRQYDHPYYGIASYSYVIFGRGFACSATATDWLRAGQAPRRGIGGRLSPVLRTHVSFDGGDGPSPVTATITRHTDGIENLDTSSLTGLADVTWEISTPRTGWLSSNVTLQYTDRELGTLIEDTLELFQAPSPTGPWTPVGTQILDTHRNEVMGVVSTMGHFAIQGDYRTGTTGMSSEGIVEHLLGLIPEAPGMDVNGDGHIDASDLTRNLGDIAN